MKEFLDSSALIPVNLDVDRDDKDTQLSSPERTGGNTSVTKTVWKHTFQVLSLSVFTSKDEQLLTVLFVERYYEKKRTFSHQMGSCKSIFSLYSFSFYLSFYLFLSCSLLSMMILHLLSVLTLL